MQDIIPPAKETKFREEAPWFLMKPVNETPYVTLSSGGMESGWVPPYGVSALPEKIRKKVPQEYQYWKEKDEKRRKEIRDELVEKLGKTLIEKALSPGARWARAAYSYVLSQQQMTIWWNLSSEEKLAKITQDLNAFLKLQPPKSEFIPDAITWLKKSPNEMKDIIVQILEVKKSEKVKFVLQWHFWRGQKVIRAGVTQQHWDLRLDFPSQKGLMHFVLGQNPLKNTEVSALWKPCPYKEWMKVSQYLPPKEERKQLSDAERAKLPRGIEEANPTKNTPSYIEIIDGGEVIVFEDSDAFKKFQFEGKKLKGLWTFEREGTSKFWIIKQSSLPQIR